MCEPAWAGVTGYYLLGEEGPQILSCLERLHRRGTRILFDPSPLAGDIAPALRKRILAISDVLTPSEKELDALGGHEGGSGWSRLAKRLFGSRGHGAVWYRHQGRDFPTRQNPVFRWIPLGRETAFQVRCCTPWHRGGTLREGIVLAGPVCGQDSGTSRPPWILEEERRFLSLKISKKALRDGRNGRLPLGLFGTMEAF